ncbi:MAG: Kelch repeat-containing protein, partial [Patescibacteria group bacterium]
TASLLTATSNATSAIYNGYIYIIGGCASTCPTNEIEYSPINADGTVGTWSTTTSLPVATYRATSVVYNGYVYEIGGWNGSAYLATVDYFSVISGNLNVTNSINNNTLISLNGFTGAVTTAGNLTVTGGGVNTINGNTILTSSDLNVSGLPTPTGLASGSTSNVGGLLPAGTYYYEIIAQNITPLSTSTSFPSQSISVTVNTTISPPTGVTASVGTSGTVGSNLAVSTTYYYEVTATTPNGETTKSLEVSAAEGATAYPITISWSTDSGATGYNIYKGTASGGEQFLASVSGGSTTSYVDSGNQATVTWGTTTPLLTGKYIATSVEYNGYVYEIGGCTTTCAVSTVDYASINSDGTIGAWTATTPLLAATYGATSVVYNGYVYEIGGYTTAAVATVDYAPINSDGTIGAWTATTPLLTAIGSATSVAYNGYMYEIGGWNTASVAPVDYAPINTNGTLGAWTATNPLPVATSTATSVVYNGYVYEIGGYTSTAVATVDYAPILSSGALGAWTATTSLPVATYYATSVVYNGYVYEIGGYNGSVNFSTVDYAPIQSSGTLGLWTATTSLPVVTSEATSVVYNGYVYEMGGCPATCPRTATYYLNLTSPSVPPLINTATTNTNQIGLTWNQIPGANSYNIYRSTSPNFTNATEYTVNSNAYNMTTPIPTATGYATSVEYNGYVYEIGGQNNQGLELTTVDYAPINADGTIGTWTATTPLLAITYSATSVVYNGYLYELGGQSGSTYETTVDYAPINSNGTLGAWTATTPLLTGVFQATSVVYNGYIYEIGGYTGSAVLSAVDYAPINADGTIGSWTATSSLLTTTTQSTSVVYNGYVYEIGGYNGSTKISTVEYAPINSNGTLGTWMDTTSLPAPTYAQTSVVYNGYVYNIGGWNSTSISTVDYALLNSNGTLGTWISASSLPVGISDATSVVYNGYLYEIGG